MIFSSKLVKDPLIDLVIVIGPIIPEEFQFYNKYFGLIAMPAVKSSLLFFSNDIYEEMCYYESL